MRLFVRWQNILVLDLFLPAIQPLFFFDYINAYQKITPNPFRRKAMKECIFLFSAIVGLGIAIGYVFSFFVIIPLCVVLIIPMIFFRSDGTGNESSFISGFIKIFCILMILSSLATATLFRIDWNSASSRIQNFGESSKSFFKEYILR